jgi:hypothetical protein
VSSSISSSPNVGGSIAEPTSSLRREWLDIHDIVIVSGWSRDHVTRHLTRLFDAGSPDVINSAIPGKKANGKKPKRHLQISRRGLDSLLASLTGKAQREAEL